MEKSASQIPWKSMYKLMTGAILPRPIGWISTINQEGQSNLAPFSFFNGIGSNPPLVVFSPVTRSSDWQPKDTLRNVRQTGEFVINIVTLPLAEAMNATSAELPPETSEFEAASLTMQPSHVVRPPRVAESPVHFECQVYQIVDIGDWPGAGSLIIGQIVHVHVQDNLLIGKDKIDLQKLQPIGRLSGGQYCKVSDVFKLQRPKAHW